MIEQRIKELGFEVPEAPVPLAAYIPSLVEGNFVYTAGQLPVVKGELKYKGKLGKEFSIEEGQRAAAICALNCLGAVKKAVGDLDKVAGIVKLTVFISSAEGFTNQPKVANGASELLVKIFGDNGKHVRSAVGVSELPLGAAVEIEMIAKIE
jgi:enamine deaminase RidA (YjgF/YER057c/UK114 family)